MSSHPVVDPQAVTRLVGRIIRDTGSQSAAARKLGCSQRHVCRLAHGEVPARIRAAFLKSLSKYLAHAGLKTELRQLGEAVTDQKADTFHRSVYRPWLYRALDLGPGVEVIVRGKTYTIRNGSGATLEQALAHLDARYAKRLEKFRADHTDHDEHRVTLAIQRALNIPLIEDWRASGTVELSARELHDKGLLDAYLRAALRREAILLQRSPDLRRVVELQRAGGTGVQSLTKKTKARA
jgi:hypothetical protein